MAHSTEHRFPLHAQARACRSLGLQGRHTARSGLDALLQGTGLQAVEQAPGSYVLRVAPAVRTTAPAAAATLAEVRVTSTARRAMPC